MDALQEAYGQNNDGSQLKVFTYESSDAVDKEVRSRNYINNPFCFAIGWNAFKPDQDIWDIDIRFENVWSPYTLNDQVEQ